MKYRKKPIVIDAVQYNGDFEVVNSWLDALGCQEDEDPSIEQHQDGSLTIRTLEGEIRAGVRDWIIRGIKGEFYPCKPDIFEKTYEPAEAQPRSTGIITDMLQNHLPRVTEGLRAGYVDENQILVMYDHAVRARTLRENGC